MGSETMYVAMILLLDLFTACFVHDVVHDTVIWHKGTKSIFWCTAYYDTDSAYQ